MTLRCSFKNVNRGNKMLQLIEDVPTDLNKEMRDFLTAFQLKHATSSTVLNVRFDKINKNESFKIQFISRK